MTLLTHRAQSVATAMDTFSSDVLMATALMIRDVATWLRPDGTMPATRGWVGEVVEGKGARWGGASALMRHGTYPI